MPYKDPNKQKQYRKEYNMKNRENLLEYQKEYDQKRSIRRSLHYALKKKTSTETPRTLKYLGCCVMWWKTEYWPSKIAAWNHMYPEHKLDLESNDIVIDLVKPMRAFEANEMHECWHYTNLQPLPKAISRLKRDTWSSRDEFNWRWKVIFNDKYTDPYLPVEMEKDGVMAM